MNHIGVDVNVRDLERRITVMQAEAVALAEATPALHAQLPVALGDGITSKTGVPLLNDILDQCLFVG